LVELQGKPLGAHSHLVIWLLAFWYSIFRFGGPAPNPLTYLCPVLLGDLLLDVRKRSWEVDIAMEDEDLAKGGDQ